LFSFMFWHETIARSNKILIREEWNGDSEIVFKGCEISFARKSFFLIKHEAEKNPMCKMIYLLLSMPYFCFNICLFYAWRRFV
jgi:hypothetical protein